VVGCGIYLGMGVDRASVLLLLPSQLSWLRSLPVGGCGSERVSLFGRFYVVCSRLM